MEGSDRSYKKPAKAFNQAACAIAEKHNEYNSSNLSLEII